MRLADLVQTKSLAMIDLPNQGPVQAEVFLSGQDSTLVLHGSQAVAWDFKGKRCLTGRLVTGARASFLGCHQTAEWEKTSPDGPLFSSHYFPHYVAVGGCHITEETRLVRVHLKVLDAPSLFHDPDAFGSVRVKPDQLASVLADHPRPPSLGDRPRVAFFSGRELIFAQETAIGRVSASNCVSYDWGGPEGTALNNRIILTLEPAEPCTLDEMMERVHGLLRFLHIVAGRRQVVEELAAEVADPALEAHARFVELYWSTHHREPHGEPASAHDLPLNGGEDPERFAAVLARWLELDKERWVARARFCTSVGRGQGYTADRLVAAANVFDILPKSALPSKAKPDPAIAQALKAAKALLAALPESEDRTSALNALGAVTRTNLKRKVQHRAAVVLARAQGALPDFQWLLNEAVNARNFFVHGPSSKEDRSAYFQHNLAFFTEALEFTFAASELIDAGGSYHSRHGTTGSHPFGSFIADYRQRLKRLQLQAAKTADA